MRWGWAEGQKRISETFQVALLSVRECQNSVPPLSNQVHTLCQTREVKTGIWSGKRVAFRQSVCVCKRARWISVEKKTD